MTLPKHVRSGVTPYVLLRAAGAEAEAGDDLVEDRAARRRDRTPAAALRGTPARRDQAHVGGDRLDDDARDVVVELGHARCTGTTTVSATRRSVTPAEPGSPSVATPLPPAASSASPWPW